MVSRPHEYPGRDSGSADQRAAGLTDPVGAAARGFCHQREQSLDGVEGLAGDAVPTVEDVVRASVAGDRIANFILAETGKFLGIGIVNLVNLLNPELVMPGGEVGGSRSSPARSHLRRSWEALAHALLGLLPPMVIADLGAGEGTLAQLMARTAKKVIAVDHSEKMVEFGAALAREHGFKNLEYRVGDVENPPVEAGSADLALFSQVLHYVPNPARALSAAHRILKPGGRLVILDLASHSYEQAREQYAHIWLGFAEIELHQMLKKAGFSKIQSSVVSRESEAPHFQTLLVTAVK